ncbi:hypothetical protein JCM10212_003070 [Sporobolomyces blumeae]
MNYGATPTGTSDFLSHRTTSFLQAVGLFLVLFLLALVSALFVDGTMSHSLPTTSTSSSTSTSCGAHHGHLGTEAVHGTELEELQRRIWFAERRIVELEQRAEAQEWVKLVDEGHREDE